VADVVELVVVELDDEVVEVGVVVVLVVVLVDRTSSVNFPKLRWLLVSPEYCALIVTLPATDG
jgi:hypothetical protein